MVTLNCPACGAEVVFRSKASMFAVCSYCKSTLVRQDRDLKQIGAMSDPQDEITPVQIGTKGKYNLEVFEIIGRMRVRYDGGFWNEWYVLFNDGKDGWLAEAQGFWALCRQIEIQDVPKSSTLNPGRSLTIDYHGSFVIEDLRTSECQYSEGELPFMAVKNRVATTVDMSSDNGRKMATIEYAATGDTRVYVGEYIDFDEFNFQNLRKLDGW